MVTGGSAEPGGEFADTVEWCHDRTRVEIVGYVDGEYGIANVAYYLTFKLAWSRAEEVFEGIELRMGCYSPPARFLMKQGACVRENLNVRPA
jgi:hypothetical protein